MAERKPFKTADGKSIVFSLVLLHCQGDTDELHVGGRLHSLFVDWLPGFQKFAQRHKGEQIDVDVYSYDLGDAAETRKATVEEIDSIVDDDFPHGEYGSELRCISHEGPDQFLYLCRVDAPNGGMISM